MVTEDQIKTKDPLTEESTQVEDPLIEEKPLIEKDTLIEVGDPLTKEDTLVDGPPNGGGGPPDGGRPPGPSGGQGPPGPQGPSGLVRPIIVQTPQVMLDTTALENNFDTVEQSMMQLARAQGQTNRQLQHHIQQGQANMQAHTRALQQLAISTYQRNFNHIFAIIPMYDRSDREGFFPCLECSEVAWWEEHQD